MIAATLRILAGLANHHPADMVSVHEGGVTVIVSNEFSAARWRAAFDARPEIDADVRVVPMFEVAS